MLKLRDGSRLIQTYKDKRNNRYTLMNICLNYNCTINSKGAKVVKQIYHLKNSRQEQKLYSKYGDFISALLDAQILTNHNAQSEYKIYILEKNKSVHCRV